MKRNVVGSKIVVELCSMGGIGPGRDVERRHIALDCGHVVVREPSAYRGVTAFCLRCAWLAR